jgi:hypothetical protein
MNNKLLELLKYEGPSLSEEFKKSSVSGRGTPQEVADFRENAFRGFLSRYFPFPYRLTKGNIIDSFGGESDSIDCVLLHPSHPHTIDRFEKFTVIMADAVQAAIEVKPNLQNINELNRGLVQIQTVKKLQRRESPLTAREKSVELRDESRRVPCFIFADRAKANPIDTGKDTLAYYKAKNIPVVEQVDFIVINGQGIISNYKLPNYSMIGQNTGLFWEKWGDLTVPAFLFKLNWVMPPQIHISRPIMEFYLKEMSPTTIVPIRTGDDSGA